MPLAIKGMLNLEFPYVAPDGTVMPATAYRYMDSKYAAVTKETMTAPSSCFGFDKLDSGHNVRNAFQIAYPEPYWSNGRLRGEFDTLQLGDNWTVPLERGGKGPNLEPFTSSYPEYGTGGYRQLKTDIKLRLRKVDLLEE